MGLFTTIAAMAGNAIMEKVMPEVKEKIKEKIEDAVDNLADSIGEKFSSSKKTSVNKPQDEELAKRISSGEYKTIKCGFNKRKEECLSKIKNDDEK